MPAKIEINKETEEQIKSLYLSGIGSTTICKTLSLSKQRILKIINGLGIMRNRLHSEEFYSNFIEENGKWVGFWKCEMCGELIRFSVNNKYLLNRNIKRKKICKKCSLKKQIGKGNPFYGKTHTESSINKMLISQHKTLKPISKPENEIYTLLSNYGYNVIQQKLVVKPFDLFVIELNLLIEFNGDYWHCNPNNYSSEYFHKKKRMLAKDIWVYDNNKLDLAKRNGYNIEVIWESDYKKNNNIIFEIIKKYEEN